MDLKSAQKMLKKGENLSLVLENLKGLWPLIEILQTKTHESSGNLLYTDRNTERIL